VDEHPIETGSSVCSSRSCWFRCIRFFYWPNSSITPPWVWSDQTHGDCSGKNSLPDGRKWAMGVAWEKFTGSMPHRQGGTCGVGTISELSVRPQTCRGPEQVGFPELVGRGGLAAP
jgi:hypothetical protein